MPRFLKSVGGDHVPQLDDEITISQLKALHFIGIHKKCRMTDISNAFNVTLSNVTSLIDRLIEKKYVMREDDPEDRRIVRVKLNRKGEDVVKIFEEHRKKHMNAFLQKMTDDEADTLIKIMEKILHITEGEKK